MSAAILAFAAINMKHLERRQQMLKALVERDEPDKDEAHKEWLRLERIKLSL